MKTFFFSVVMLFWALVGYSQISGKSAQPEFFRAPSVPLVTHDPYFSIWSPADKLTDKETVHWTGKRQPLSCLIRIDGTCYRLMGEQPANLPALPQTKVSVYPTRSVYWFGNDKITVEFAFITPALPAKLDILSRPVTYLNWEVKSVDRQDHDVQLLLAEGAEVAVNKSDQQVVWSKPLIQGLSVVRVGTKDQEILSRKGDDLRIDWGYAYLAVPSNQGPSTLAGSRASLLTGFATEGTLKSEVLSQPRAVNQGDVTLAACWSLGKVGSESKKSMAMLAYDDLYSLRYFDSKVKAYWKKDGQTIEQLLVKSLKEYPILVQECGSFDRELMADLSLQGGKKYASVCALAFRQCLAAHKLVADSHGKPLIFSKENFSNGCIGTVDVIYPAAPFFFLFSTELTKAMLEPNLAYAASERWKFPFAPHDVGTYPFATGQVYGGGEETEENQMPVEETGNMVIMVAALAKMEGNANYAKAHWPVLEKWCEYLLSKGFDPDNQLCTDDFAGHLAHNINLSGKAIVALGSYAMLCDMLGMKAKAVEVRAKAEAMAKDWVAKATEGDHTRLAYDRPGSWSQKYNLVWDKLLGLNLFPKEVIQKEIAYYKSIQKTYGLPLDNRARYTKNDWITWTATMADNKEDFETLFNPVFKFVNATPQRVPLSDWYNTDDATMVGFQARSVVGGFFIKMLEDPTLWKKWQNKGTNVQGPWAPLQIFKLSSVLVPASRDAAQIWSFTTDQPSADWMKSGFVDNGWNKGPAGFGSSDIRYSRTAWKTKDIWIRRTVDLKSVSDRKLALILFHDDQAEVYINGVLVRKLDGYTTNYSTIFLDVKVNSVLKSGKNTIAIHCHQDHGGQFIDLGLGEYTGKMNTL